MRRRRIAKESDTVEEPPLNLTPLIDVIFVILITFIVIAPLLELDRIALSPGKGNLEEGQLLADTSPISIQVRRDNTILLNNQQVSLDQLESILKVKFRESPGVEPQLFHDREATFGTYQEVKNAVEHAGFTQLAVVLQPT